MSQANYIIICKGRIDQLVAKKKEDKIAAASDVATLFVAVNKDKITEEDAQPISNVQHYLMDNFKTITAAELKAKIAEMFELLDALEDKLE